MKIRILSYELKLSKVRVTLLNKLRELFDDEEMILGVMVDTKNDEDAQSMLDYLNNDDTDKSYEQVILQSLDLNLKRKEKSK